MDHKAADAIMGELRVIEGLENPRSKGKALTGNLTGLWRYRVGDYRIICVIEDYKLVVLVIDIDHRENIYRR